MHTRVHRWLTQIAHIYPGEGPAVWLSFGVSFLLVAGTMFGRNARDSLFLTQIGVQYLPYMYFANAAFLVLCTFCFTALVDRIERGRLLAGASLVWVISLILSRLILIGHPHWFFPLLYMQAQVIWYFTFMQFWTFVGDLFDTRQAKRLFPFLAVGGLLGMLGVGLGSKGIVRSLGTENLLLLWAALILAALILGVLTYKRYRIIGDSPSTDLASSPRNSSPSEWEKIKNGFSDVVREPLQLSMAAYVFFMWTVYAVVDFCFNQTVQARFPAPNDLTAFLGIFVGLKGFLSLLVQLTLTRPVIGRLGVGKTISFHPASLVLGTAWMSVSYSSASVFTSKLCDSTMIYTISDSSYQLLYSPISPDRRARVRGFLEGYIRPLSLAAAGVFIIIGNDYLRPLHLGRLLILPGQQISGCACILSLVWLGFSLTAKKAYIRALLKNLEGTSSALRQAAARALANLRDPGSISVLSSALESERPERIVAAVRFLEDSRMEQSIGAIARLLDHADPRVRATAAGALGRLASQQFVDRFILLLKDPEARVRANAVEALGTTRDQRLLDKVRPLLNDPSLRVRINTMAAIASLGGKVGAEWLPMIRELARGDSLERSTATHALGRLPLEQSVELLSFLLKDPVIPICCEAAKALGRTGSMRAIPSLTEALAGAPEVRNIARRSLVSILEANGPSCTQELIRSSLGSDRPEIRSGLADVLGRLNDPQVFPALITLLGDAERRVRWRALKSLGRRADMGPLPEEARAALFQYAGSELTAFRQNLLCSQALFSHSTTTREHLLSTALQEDRAKIVERVFQVLGILCGRDQMLAIFDKLYSGEARLRSDALEALDTLVPYPIGRQVVGLLEPQPTATEGEPAPASFSVSEAASRSKPWLRACMAYYLGQHPSAEGRALLKSLLADPSEVVRETALYAGWQAFQNEWRQEIDTQAGSSDAILRRCAQRILAEASDNKEKISVGRTAMLLTVEKVLLLKSAHLFAGLESEELAALAEIAPEKEFAAGEIIFEEGQPGVFLYILIHGKVEVFHRTNSDEYSIATLGEKECFGEMAILNDEPRSASVRALEPTQVLKLDRNSFRELITERPEISFAIFKILSDRLKQKNVESEQASALDTARHYA